MPKTIPIPIGDLDKLVDSTWKDCGCFQKQCQCYGQAGCGCSYPTCACAPTMISPTELEIIIVQEECEVPQDYIETITVEVPEIIQVPFDIQEPKEVFEEVTFDVPYVIEVEETYEVPEL